MANRNQFGVELPWQSEYVPKLSSSLRPRYTMQDFRQRVLEPRYRATGQPLRATTPMPL